MEKEYFEMMIQELNKSLVQVTAFGDETGRKAIETQIAMYQAKLEAVK